jgi:hypothetical protein
MVLSGQIKRKKQTTGKKSGGVPAEKKLTL